jgi:hypothetical protein
MDGASSRNNVRVIWHEDVCVNQEAMHGGGCPQCIQD